MTDKLEEQPIPTKFKKAKAPKKVSEVKPSTTLKERLFTTAQLLIVTILLVANTFMVINIVRKVEKANEPEEQPKVETPANTEITIYGEWVTNERGMISLNDNIIYFYDNYLDKENNYQKGTFTIVNGDEALKEMGYSDEEFTATFGENVTKEHIYSIHITPQVIFSSGEDITKKSLKKNETWWLMIAIKDDGKAQAYNKTLDKRYNLEHM
jgi:hypothetical protein